jgi:creatinine amidohydrolase/Fe(II)-dependent formamide hydrolase-like protein
VLRSNRSLVLLALCALALLPTRAASAQRILRWTELNAAQLALLDRARTVVIIPAGLVEEQGTMLPVGAELFRSDRLAADIAASLAARPGWTVLMLPTIPLGSGAFDHRVGRAGFPGTLSVRAATVQAIYTDLGADLGEQGFQHLFIIDGHSEASHARALDLAGDAFGAHYRGRMIHLLGRSGCHADGLVPPPITLYSATAMTADADSPHGGTRQTARHWWLRQDLVDSSRVRTAPDATAGSLEQRTAIAQRSDWQGYVGAPRFATLELGEWLYDTEVRNCTALAHRFLDGLDEHAVPRYSDRMRADPGMRAIMDATARREAADSARRTRGAPR